MPAALRNTSILLGLLFLADLVGAGQGLYSLLVAFLGVVVLVPGAAWAALRGQREAAVRRIAKAALYVLLGVATVGALRLHTWTAQRNTARVIAACEAYRARHGQYP